MAKIGCHVSVAGGIENAPERAAAVGCETFQIFSRPPQGGPAPKISDAQVKKLWADMKRFQMDRFYIHAPYYTNFASDAGKTRGFSIVIAREELERGTLIGAKYVVIHLGSAKESSREEGVARARESIGKILEGYKGTCELLLEISAGAGNVIGDTFEELKEIMSGTKSKKLGGICLDTCHAFASGYDIDETLFEKFDKIIGLERLKLIHANDSKISRGGHQDRHQHIGYGHIGRDAFRVLRDIPAAMNVDWIVETPPDGVQDDIKVLKSIHDKKGN